MKRTLALTGLVVAIAIIGQAARAAEEAAWWEGEKLRWFWGQWCRFEDGDRASADYETFMKHISRAGVTVFASPYGDWRERAPLAKKYGLHYFRNLKVSDERPLAEKVGARLAVNRRGLTCPEELARGMRVSYGAHVPCPLDEKAVNAWLLEPALEWAASGVVDGCLIDWEPYGATGFEHYGMRLCYCDYCFADYMEKKGLSETVARAERYNWLQAEGLHYEYLSHERDRLKEVYRQVADKVHEIKRDFVFSAYPGFVPGMLETTWRLEGAALGLHSSETPFFVVDSSQYSPNHDQPWWDTTLTASRKLGFRHILGTWTSIFGRYPALDVSATQWMYDAAISHDGYWVWFEHEWGPNDFRAFRTADRRIRTVEGRVGDFLLAGEQDHAFVCLVEQSGDPALGRKMIQRTYHLDGRHLVRINNVNTDVPVEVLARFPRLKPNAKWIVRDPIGDFYYTHSDGETMWGSEDLKRGLFLPLEKRSELWVVVSPAKRARDARAVETVSAEITRSHPARRGTAGAVSTGSGMAWSFPRVFVKRTPLEYYGTSARSLMPVTGTMVSSVDAGGDGKEERGIYSIKGNCWSPTLSPVGKRVAFSCYVNGQGQIYVQNADGSGAPFNVSHNGFCDASPAWSPDGTQVAFVSDRDGDWEIYVSDPDGSVQRRLTESPGIDRAPAWSADGRTIAFETDRDGDFDIYVIQSDGSGERALVSRSGNEYEPAWSPDGKLLACAVTTSWGNREILVVDATDGSTALPGGLTEAAKGWSHYKNITSISWSPDGKRIAAAFEKYFTTGVFAVTADGSILNELVVREPLKTYPGGAGSRGLVGGRYFTGSASRRWLLMSFGDVAWSPDGTALAFRSDMDGSGYAFLYTAPADGGDVKRLDITLDPAGPENEPVAIRGASKAPEVSGFASSWSHVARYLDGPDYVRMLARLREVAPLPLEGWSFKADPEAVGVEEGYFRIDFDSGSLPEIAIGQFWDDQGHKELKQGWYFLRWRCPDLPEGKRVFLNVGAIDEQGWLYIDGHLAAWYDSDDPARTWDDPVLLEVTGNLEGGREHLLGVRVRNDVQVGGLWKPIALMVEK